MEEIKKQKEFLDCIIETSNAIILNLDRSGNIVIFNKAAENITGYNKSEVIGENWFNIFVPKDKFPDVWDEFNKIIADPNKITNYENPILTKDGSERYIMWQNNAILENNKLSSIVSVGIDITERKKVEKELIEAKNKSEKSDKLKTSFLSNMSHEIRTPMNSILGFSSLLIDELNDSDRKYYISIINNNCNILLNIINDILDISKIESGQIEIYNSETCVNTILSEILMLKFSENDNIKIFTYKPLSDKQSTIFTDKTKLKQIITNLLNNAFKFTHKGTINIGYELKNNFLEFYVEDTGIGICENKKDIIFDRFKKIDETNQYGGTGLGLSISKSYIEAMGGKIWLESEVDVGSKFYFTIPYKNVYDEKIEIDNKNNYILLVEDEEDNYLYLDICLKKLGVNKIIHARTANETLELFNKNKNIIKLILLDMRLPDKMGHEIIKDIFKIKKVPIIIQSAYDFNDEKLKAFEYGCSDYITKPITQESIRKIIEKYYY